MEQRFFDQPILNSPYEYPARHWELDANRQPTNRSVERRRSVSFITPIPAARKQRAKQREMVFDEAASALGTDGQQYDLTAIIESVRHRVDEWRRLPRARWRVTPQTARLLETEGQVLQRVLPGLMGMKQIMAFNDEAHDCYREKPAEQNDEGALNGDDRKEADRNS